MCTSYCVYEEVRSASAISIPSYRRQTIFFHVISWGYPMIGLVLLLSLDNTSDEQDIGCWIPRVPLRNILLRLETTYIPLWVSWCFNTVTYAWTARLGKRAVNETLSAVLHSESSPQVVDSSSSSSVLPLLRDSAPPSNHGSYGSVRPRYLDVLPSSSVPSSYSSSYFPQALTTQFKADTRVDREASDSSTSSPSSVHSPSRRYGSSWHDDAAIRTASVDAAAHLAAATYYSLPLPDAAALPGAVTSASQQEAILVRHASTSHPVGTQLTSEAGASDPRGVVIVANREVISQLHSQITRLQLIPIIFVLLRFWGSVNVIKDCINPKLHLFIIDLLEAIGDQAQAFVHGLFFVFAHQGVRQALRLRWLGNS